MSEILKDYFYTGVSFSSFSIDESVLLCLKYEKSKFINRILQYNKLKKYLKKHQDTDECIKGNEKYLVYQNMVALKNSSILFSSNKEEIKLYRMLKNDKEADVCEKFDIGDMTIESLESPITLVLKTEESVNQYQDIISKCKKVKLIYLNKLKEETQRDIIFDAIKVKLLQDETEIYFIEKGMYSNYVANCVFGLNKIAIIL
jgi:hypothetical protein